MQRRQVVGSLALVLYPSQAHRALLARAVVVGARSIAHPIALSKLV